MDPKTASDSASTALMATSDNDLDKECSALSSLFQQIINEMRTGIPNFEEFVTKATKLHGTLRSTIVVLASFLDTFQKIADAATNTKGATRDIGTCLTRIVIRHRAMESRMKSLAGALMDCMIMPIQNKLEEWKKVTHSLDKDHAREFKKRRIHIKKKSEQVMRIRKKLRKGPHGSSALTTSSTTTMTTSSDHSAQRLLDGCSKDLNGLLRQLHDNEKKYLRLSLTEERSRYCTFANCLRPIIDEEFGLLGELNQVEEVVHKLAKASSAPGTLPESCEQIIEDASASAVDVTSVLSSVAATPPATPSPSAMGSRKNSMTSLSSMNSMASSKTASAVSPSHSTTSSKMADDLSLASGSIRLSTISNNSDTVSISSNIFNFDTTGVVSPRPGSTASTASGIGASSRPHTISSAFQGQYHHQRPSLSKTTFLPPEPELLDPSRAKMVNSEPASPSKGRKNETNASLFEQSFSTIKRVYSNRGSPFRRPQSGFSQENKENAAVTSKRPPLPQRCSSVDRNSARYNNAFDRSLSVPSGPTPNSHYAVPRNSLRLQMVPDFHQGKTDMVIPQPIYLNSSELKGVGPAPPTSAPARIASPSADDDLKTPTVEELTFPGHASKPVEDGSSTSSSGSIGSSSGYGSQSTILTKSIESTEPPGRPKHVHTPAAADVDSNRHSHNHNIYTNLAVLNNLHQIGPEATRHQWNEQLRALLTTNHRRSMAIRRSDSFTPGCPIQSCGAWSSRPESRTLQRSTSHVSAKTPPPPPPVRRTPSISRNLVEDKALDPDDEATPHGSVEDMSAMPEDEDSLGEMARKASDVAQSLQNSSVHPASILRRSTSMSNGPSSLPQQFQRDPVTRRSLNMTNGRERFATLHENITTRIPQSGSRIPQPASGVGRTGTHHVIPVRGEKLSPEGEIYGFGMRFKESSRQYFDHKSPPNEVSTVQVSGTTTYPEPQPQPQVGQVSPIRMSVSYPTANDQLPQPPRSLAMSKEAIQNQLFLDSLSAKLTGNKRISSYAASSETSQGPQASPNSATLSRLPQPRNEYHF